MSEATGNAPLTAVSSAVETAPLAATGASLTAATDNVSIDVAMPPWPSDT